jgi:DNA polymerase-1
MRIHIFDAEQSAYDVAILIKESHFDKSKMTEYYIKPLVSQGMEAKQAIAFDLPYDKKKVSSQCIKSYLKQLLPVLQKYGIKYIYCADAEYFKVLAKQAKATSHIGYTFNCGVVGFEYMQVMLGINHGILMYDPNQAPKLDLSLHTLTSVMANNYKALGTGIIQYACYPQTNEQIQAFLDGLHKHPTLTCDIEAFSLNLFKAGLGSIAFAWNKNEGGAFLIDYLDISELASNQTPAYYARQKPNQTVKRMLRQFFIKYQGKLIFHNATYDIKVQILNLFMEHATDYKGMLYGLEVMTRHFDDTKVIAFLALNTTVDISLSLKDLAHEYAGNYAQDDINDIRLIPAKELLEYNLVDCLSTWYVYDKYYPQMLRDNQKEIYDTIMKPSLKILIQMELVGMPIDLNRVSEVEAELLGLQSKYLNQLKNASCVLACEKTIKYKALTAINAKLKTKQHGMDKVADIVFNPNSGNHLIELLYTVMSLPVLDYTATKQPATGADSLEKLINHTTNQEYKDVINALIGLSKVDKILTSFIPSFKEATVKGGMAWLHANFNLNGTMSGRLSCTKPNLQQIPSGSDFGKLIKSCFKAPKGMLFAGADFNALESRINALLTKDINKLKVFTQGYDSHCINAFAYFKNQMPDIKDTLSDINSIKKKYPDLRQASKAVTFAAQYGGTYLTFMNNCGFSETQAKQIEANYHELYKESDAWVKDKLDLCCKQGYIDVAFGLRIRTPLLAKSVLDNSKTLREAQAEARSVGNAISGQSYGLLNNRAAIAFMNRVWASEFKYDIFLVSLIHDAIYLIMRDNVRVVEWVNKALIEEMAWQELPEIQHPQVKLGAELDIFYQGWHQPITLPNVATAEQIKHICRTEAANYTNK